MLCFYYKSYRTVIGANSDDSNGLRFFYFTQCLKK